MDEVYTGAREKGAAAPRARTMIFFQKQEFICRMGEN
jgi:hypothetical protein